MTRQRSVFLLLPGALAWVAIAVGGAMVAGYALDAGAVLLHLPAPSALLQMLGSTLGFQLVLLLGAVWQGRQLGKGDWNAGLGTGPMRRKRVVALLCLAMLVWLAVLMTLVSVFPFLRDLVKSSPSDVMNELGDAGPGIVVLNFVLLVIVAPVSEELFFRGWLWEALRRRGMGVSTTIGLTALPWLLLHGIDSPGRILFLLPAAVALSLARYLGGGVRASLTVHIVNNAAATLTEIVSLMFQ